MNRPDKMMTIGEMTARFDVTARTLRFYEAKGLLAPVREGQRRLFTARDRARLTLILRGKRFGFSLGEISALLALYDAGDGQRAQLEATLQTARQRLASMIAQRDELTEAIAELTLQIDDVAAMLNQSAAHAHQD